MEIVSDPALQTVLESLLATQSGLDISVIQLEAYLGGRARATLPGLDVAVERIREDRSVLMLSFLSPLSADLADDYRWQAVYGYPRTAFMRLPVGGGEIIQGMQLAQQAERPADRLALALVDLKLHLNPVGRLQHDLRYALRDEDRREAWMNLARPLYGDKPFEELAAMVQSAGPERVPAPFAGQSFPDICVDVEGTLVQEGRINRELVDRIAEEAGGQPITVWTGGDLKEASKLIRPHVGWKLVSKYSLRGARVAHAYDDLPQAEFVERYGIEADEYIQI